MADKFTLRKFLWAATISSLLLVAPLLTSAQSKSGTQAKAASVALVAQIPESISLAAKFQPAPEMTEADGSRSSILVLESAWHLAMGHSVSASAHFGATSEANQSGLLIRLRQAGDPLELGDIPVFGFLARQTPARVILVDGVNPRLGRQTQISGLLILHPEAPADQTPAVIIAVTAL